MGCHGEGGIAPFGPIKFNSHPPFWLNKPSKNSRRTVGERRTFSIPKIPVMKTMNRYTFFTLSDSVAKLEPRTMHKVQSAMVHGY